ncbi:MAG: leucine--tRNA ligase, partial [Clostridia bacterium]|nr:leucine--tRNA ligase [Clostridia bacterium]
MDFKKIEKKWQDTWDKEHRYHAIDGSSKPKYYVLVEFPFPSGSGLHVGHTTNQIAMDIVARKKRAEGYNVLFPIGWDSFGLPTENYAIKEHTTPQAVSKKNIAHFIEQIKSLGISFDWDREIATSNEDYYRWTQWLFLQFYKAGLAYKATANINWCPNCKIGLSNEESSGGVCERCGTPTVQKPKSQWMLKMSAYSEKLLDGLDDTLYWDSIKAMQRKWIGKSEGTNMTCKLSTGDTFDIYTTCIETVMGITYFVFAPEMPLVEKLKDKITNYDEVEKYVYESSRKSEFERTELIKEKTGCELKGIYAIHPITGAHVPVFISDYVIATYGSGAVMAVPAHDERDWEFAKKFNLPMVEVISGGDISKQAFEKADYLGKGCKLVNSGEFTGLTVEQAKEKLTEYLVKHKLGEHTTNYKMRDWVFSRQRYWGEPVPLVYCDKCGWVPVPDNELPVTLPIVDHYTPTDDGESPLSRIDSWVNTTCPHCGGKAKRETDVMPNWAGSSWYWLRYMDPHNDHAFADMDKLKYWGMVDLYNGGGEHVTRHLLYARFWHKFLYDQGLVPTSEPFLRRVQQGLILGSDGTKMSKSRGNVVDPMLYVKEYGADVCRLAQMFMGDYTATKPWSEDTLKPCQKLLTRIEALKEKLGENSDKDKAYMMATTTKNVTQDIDTLKFNTGISAIMIYVNYLETLAHVSKEEYKTLLRLLSPYAPHFAEEMFEVCGFGKIDDFAWPTYNEKDLVQSQIEYAVQVNSKIIERG